MGRTHSAEASGEMATADDASVAVSPLGLRQDRDRPGKAMTTNAIDSLVGGGMRRFARKFVV